ncbi:MAG TPA: hypothetical protein VMI35_11545 [Puia sp.]|nr:hypothetical protein [Puia sp.]
MFRHPVFATIFVSLYLLAYCVLMVFGDLPWLTAILFLLSPFFVIWMAYTIMRHGRYQGPELGEEEFGYQDREHDSLGIF